VFEGLYAIATCNTDFGEGVYIRIKPLGQLAINNVLGKFGVSQNVVDETINRELQSFYTKNDAFDTMFSINCKKFEDAENCITPELSDLLISIKENLYAKKIQLLSNPISILLKNKEVHIALYELDVFDMEAFRSNTATNITERYYNFVRAAIDIVESIKRK
jgi:hypothetical protein